MKNFVVLSAVVLMASAMPTDVGKDATDLIKNGTTRNVFFGLAGFATLNGGVQGGNGGAVWTVWDAFALRDSLLTDNRRMIYVRGRIDLNVLFTASPGIRLRVGSFKSILGGDRNAMIFGGGLQIQNARNIIIQDIRFHNALSFNVNERPNGNGGISNMVSGDFSEIDAIEIRNSLNVWIHHCEFADDPWNALSTPRRHDGLIDVVRGSNWVSISNNIFRNHNYVTLIGNGDGNAAEDTGRLKTTIYLNWYQGTVQRNPRVRFGEVHVLNNLYTDIRDYGIGAGAGARVYAERNSFINTRRAWGFPAGTPNPLGHVFPLNNWFENSSFDSGIPSNVGFVPSQYYRYDILGSNAVAAHVRRYAGIR